MNDETHVFGGEGSEYRRTKVCHSKFKAKRLGKRGGFYGGVVLGVGVMEEGCKEGSADIRCHAAHMCRNITARISNLSISIEIRLILISTVIRASTVHVSLPHFSAALFVFVPRPHRAHGGRSSQIHHTSPWDGLGDRYSLPNTPFFPSQIQTVGTSRPYRLKREHIAPHRLYHTIKIRNDRPF